MPEPAIVSTPPLSPQDVCDIAVPAGKRVLLLGCSDGLLGAALLAAGATEVVGIDSRARATARARLTAVMAVDPDGAPELPWPEGYFELLVIEDLSRLLDPAVTLAHLRRWLADEGRLVAVIPNALHEASASALLTSGRLPAGAGVRPLPVAAGLDALSLGGFQVEDEAILVKTEAGPAASHLCRLAAALGGDPDRAAEALTLVRAVLAARPRERIAAGGRAIPDPWRGSRPVKVLVTPDLASSGDGWAEALRAMASTFAASDNVTIGVTLPAHQLDAPPPSLQEALGGVACDLVLIEEPGDHDGWARLLAGAGCWIPTADRPLLRALARGVGVAVQAP